MPLYPSTEPTLSSFGPILHLDDITKDETCNGPAPWATPDSSNPTQAKKLNLDPTDPTHFSKISPLLIGGGVFGEGMYNDQQLLKSEMPIRGELQLRII